MVGGSIPPGPTQYTRESGLECMIRNEGLRLKDLHDIQVYTKQFVDPVLHKRSTLQLLDYLRTELVDVYHDTGDVRIIDALKIVEHVRYYEKRKNAKMAKKIIKA
jgi:hypothetical protein